MTTKEFNELSLPKKVELIEILLGDQKPGISNTIVFREFFISFLTAFVTGQIWQAEAHNYPKHIHQDIEKTLKEKEYVYLNFDQIPAIKNKLFQSLQKLRGEVN